MKLTPQETAFFRDVSGSEMGSFFRDYLERVEDHVYNSKYWKEGETKESAALAARTIRELIIEKIRPKNDKSTGLNHFE